MKFYESSTLEDLAAASRMIRAAMVQMHRPANYLDFLDSLYGLVHKRFGITRKEFNKLVQVESIGLGLHRGPDPVMPGGHRNHGIGGNPPPGSP